MWCLAALVLMAADPLAGGFEFGMPPVKAVGSWVDLSVLNGPAGSVDGGVSVSEGHFVNSAGQRLRLLGTNLTFATAFPDNATATLLADRMAQLGFNVVRLHHIDNGTAPRGLWADSSQTALDPAQMDRLDWLIAELARNGIYVNLNLHVSRSYAGFNWQGLPTTFNYGKTIDHYHPRMIEQQHDYARQILAHHNPYRNKTYGEDGAIAFVELNNENSLTGQANNRQLLDLPDEFAAPLQSAWRTYVRDKYGDLASAQAAWTTGIEPLGQEVLVNGTFAAGANGWSLELPAPAKGSQRVVAGPNGSQALRAEMTQLGTESWHFQVHQVGLDLQEGQYYTVSFDGRASEPRPITVGARKDEADWHALGGDLRTELMPEWQHYTHTFQATRVTPHHSRLSFTLGNKLGWIELANISLRPGMDTRLPAGASLDTLPLPVNASLPRQAADWLACCAQLERRYVTDLRDEVKRLTGGRKLVIDSQANYGGALGLMREADLSDYIDMHAYWQHPSFPGRPWDGNDWTIANTPLVAAPDGGSLFSLAAYRLAGKPFSVSEYDHPAPSLYAAEMMPMLAAIAAWQDWDALYQFDYGDTKPTEPAKIGGYFQMVTNPSKVALAPVAAVLFRGGHAPTATAVQRLRLPRSLAASGSSLNRLWQGAGVNGLDLLTRGRGEVQLVDEGAEATVVEAGQANTPVVRWVAEPKDQAALEVATPEAAAATGFLGGRTVQLGPFSVEVGRTERNHATVAVASLDGQPLTTSKRMLLVVVGATGNQGMGWNETLTSVGSKWGTGPTVAEPIEARLDLQGLANCRVRVLGPDGVPGAEVGSVRVGNALHVILGPANRTIWYAVERP